MEVLVEAGVVDGAERSEPHGHGRVLPEVRHQPRVGVRREAHATDLLAEVVQLLLRKATLEEGAAVDSRSGVALDVHVVAGQAVVLAAEEVVEADFVERRRAGEGGEVTADPVGLLVGPDDHHRGVPADVGADAALDVLVAREEGLLLGGDRVHIRRRHRRRVPDLQLVGTLQQLGDEEPGSGLAARVDHRVQRVEPLARLARIGVGELVDEAVDDHGHIVAPRGLNRALGGRTIGAFRCPPDRLTSAHSLLADRFA